MTTSPRIDQYSKATANNDLGPDEMKALVERLDSLDVPGKKEIRKVINTVLAKHKTDVSHSSDLSPYGAKVSSRATSPSKSTTAKNTTPKATTKGSKKTTKINSGETAKAKPRVDTESSPDNTEKSKRPDWMQPRDS